MEIVNYVEKMKTTKYDTHEGFKVKEDIQAFGETLTITQTVEIPADHRVFFEFLAPKEIPVGKAYIELKVTSAVEQEKMTVPINENKQATPISDSLLDILSQKPTPRANRLLGIAADLGNISLEEIRAERLSKYLL